MFHRPKTEQASDVKKSADKDVTKEDPQNASQNASMDVTTEQKKPSGNNTVNVTAKKIAENAASQPVATEQSNDKLKEEKKETSMSQENQKNDNTPASDAKNASPAYQTHTAQPASTFQTSYGANAQQQAQASQPALNDSHAAENRRLVISQGITMSGEIAACDHLVVEGTVEAALQGANVLDIAETGTFYGSVEIDEATIAGRFEGEISVNGRLTIKSTGTVTGSISYKELQVEAGASIDGKISPLAAPAATSSAAPQTKKAPVRNDNSSELPFSGNAAAAAE